MPSQNRRPRLGSHSRSSPNLPSLSSIHALEGTGSALSSPLAHQQYSSTKESFPELHLPDDHAQNGKNGKPNGAGSPAAQRYDVNGRNTTVFEGGSNGSDPESYASDKEDGHADDYDDDATPQGLISPRRSYMNAKAAASMPASVANTKPSPQLARLHTSLDSTSHTALRSTYAPERPLPERAHSLFGQSAPRSQSSTNLSAAYHHTPAAFAPPFYNRPPTPLPPSPSLTSLLRPSFSTSTVPSLARSRSATPSIVGGPSPTDSSSDTDATTPRLPGAQSTSSLGGLNRAALAAPPSDSVRRAAPPIPTYEYYGFVLYLGSSLFFVCYVLWASLPTPILHGLGVTYYPSRWWSLAVPCWIVVGLIWIYVALASYNTTVLTEPVGNIGCFVDNVAAVAIVDDTGKIIRRDWRKKPKDVRAADGGSEAKRRRRDKSHATSKSINDSTLNRDLEWRVLWNEGTDAVLDVPIGGVCEVLYGEFRDRSDGEDDDNREDLMADHEQIQTSATLDTG